MEDNAFCIRRLVTGLDEDGKSIIKEDSASPYVTFLNETGSFALADLWRTNAAPSSARAADLLAKPSVLAPTFGGSVLRIMRFPPEDEMAGVVEQALETSDASAVQAFAGQDGSIHPMMHKTKTIDYAIVISGEIWAIMEKGERLMHAGDVLIQRATSHAWANRSCSPCVVAFVLIDAEDR